MALRTFTTRTRAIRLLIVVIHQPRRLQATWVVRLSSPCYSRGIEPRPSGKCRSWIRYSGRCNLFYQLISNAPRRLRVPLLILRLRHLLLLTARIESVYDEDANHDHDSEDCHANFLANASCWRRLRVQLDPGRRFDWLFLVVH